MDDIQLGKEQRDCLEQIKQFILGNQAVFVMSGSAGTGKTLLTLHIIKYIKDIGLQYCLCAPTHKAALVMEQYTGAKAKTLHSLLAMSPKLDILQLNLRQLEFNSGESKDIPNNGIVICDEASMINDDLFDFLCNRCLDRQTKLLLVQDSCQLQPVKQDSKSKVSLVQNQFTLNKIYRQENDSALKDILATLRDRPLETFTSDIKEKGSIICTSNIKDFAKEAIIEFKNAIGKQDILQTKILAYTNKQVDIYNKTIHKYLFPENNQYNQYEFLTCHCNMTRNFMEFWNSMDYIIVDKPERIDIDIPNYEIVPGFKLRLYDSLTHTSGIIKMIDRTYDNFKNLAATIETLRMEAVEEKKTYAKRQAWKEYYKTTESFCSPIDLNFMGRLIFKKSFDYGYAITTHRSQGSTIGKVFVDMRDIFKQKNPEELRQLQYVALSRTRKDVVIYL